MGTTAEIVQTPLFETPQELVDNSFVALTSAIVNLTVDTKPELTSSERDDLRIARQLRTRAMFEKFGDDEYRSFKPSAI